MLKCLSIWPYRHLIRHKAWADFRAQSQRTHLGFVWWLLDPIISTAVYYLVFGIFMGRGESEAHGGEPFVPYLVTGIVGWLWYNSAVNTSARSIWTNIGLIRRVSSPRIVFPISSVIEATLRFSFALIVLFVTLLFYGYLPNLHWLLVLVPMVAQLLLILGCGLLLAAVLPFFPDLANLIPYLLRIGFFMSGVMYYVEDRSETVQSYLRCNPMVHVLNGYRDVLMRRTIPDWHTLGLIAGLSLIGIYVGAYLIHRFEGLYAKRTVQ